MKTENYQNAFPAITFDTDGRIGTEREGLTKREYFAAMAVQGLLARKQGWGNYRELTDTAVDMADSLIESINRTAPK